MTYKAVICVETQEIFDTITEAAEKTGADRGEIINVCKCRKETTHGCHWMYYDEYLAKQ